MGFDKLVAAMIRVGIPYHLRNLARVPDDEVSVEVVGEVTINSVLDALEAKYPMLRGTVRDHDTHERRKLLRYFTCCEDWSHEETSKPLPAEVMTGKEPFLIVGSIAGG